MDDLYLIIEFLLATFLAGIIATGGMTVFMNGITRAKITNADMVRAVGSMFTKGSGDAALMVGAMLHLISGVGFAMIYTIIVNFFGVPEGIATIGGMTLLGAFHGFVLSFLLVVSVAEHHPLQEFQEAGIGVAVAHFVGHIVYGFLLGAVITALRFRIV